MTAMRQHFLGLPAALAIGLAAVGGVAVLLIERLAKAEPTAA